MIQIGTVAILHRVEVLELKKGEHLSILLDLQTRYDCI
jgi:hypothetical protein